MCLLVEALKVTIWVGRWTFGCRGHILPPRPKKKKIVVVCNDIKLKDSYLHRVKNEYDIYTYNTSS